MSLTALDGLIMGTRTGAIDPGAVIYMLQTEQRSADDVVDILYRQSGLLGISGVSSDMRLLRKENGNFSVKQAIELFTYRIVQEIGALIAVLGGLDALVFTAGIGEHDAALRHDVCSAFAWMGIVLDQSRNDQMSSVISAEDSKICVFVEPTNENLMICRAVLGCLNESRSS
ncbi:acetate kinase [Acetobacter oeni LMG 21952]|nr:acetate kinase [Acetobacter oeni LMG 21952]